MLSAESLAEVDPHAQISTAATIPSTAGHHITSAASNAGSTVRATLSTLGRQNFVLRQRQMRTVDEAAISESYESQRGITALTKIVGFNSEHLKS